MMVSLLPADKLQESVVLGIKKLTGSPRFQHNQAVLSLQEQLRPLFCPMEINIKSDITTNESGFSAVSIPAEFFVDDRLLPQGGDQAVVISRPHYEAALTAFGSHFPETNRADADHAWLTPVKATADKMAVTRLLERGLVDEKFIADVLSVDFTNPVFSAERCQLLKLVPKQQQPGWRPAFIQALQHSPLPAAQVLAEALLDPAMTPSVHQQQALQYLQLCRRAVKKPDQVKQLVKLLAQRRAEVLASEISKNPRGQILEPGFRVIFPELQDVSRPGVLSLDEQCRVVG
jgi:hypothetical protein